MTPEARIEAAAGVLDAILAGQPAEQALLRWSRGSRFAGSGDRAAVRDLVFDSLRRRRSRAVRGGALSGRGLMLGMLHEEGRDPATVFGKGSGAGTGRGYGPAPLSEAEQAARAEPGPEDLLDLPDWLLAPLRAVLGTDADKVALAMRDRAPVWLRVNPRRADPPAARAALAAEGIATRPDPRLPGALEVTAGARKLARSRAYAEGMVELQDLSPQMACAALPLADGARVLDYCAGGGGKALALAARARIKVVAHDADPGRMHDLPARAERAGVGVTLTDTPQGLFDLVVADVPCSGSGTWRRAPDAKWTLTPERLDQLIGLQRDILASAAAFVRPGGHLAYMTCSVLDAENRAQVACFLSTKPGFSLVEQRLFLPLTESDGFYLAVMARA